jgi:hypothetical protein
MICILDSFNTTRSEDWCSIAYRGGVPATAGTPPRGYVKNTCLGWVCGTAANPTQTFLFAMDYLSKRVGFVSFFSEAEETDKPNPF